MKILSQTFNLAIYCCNHCQINSRKQKEEGKGKNTEIKNSDPKIVKTKLTDKTEKGILSREGQKQFWKTGGTGTEGNTERC